MTDPVSITNAVIASFTNANNLIKAIIGVRDNIKSLEQVNALQSEISSIQTGYFSLLQQNTAMVTEREDLKKEIANLKAWKAEQERYELKKISHEVYAYALKESACNGEPSHLLCCHCYNNSKKEILHLENPSDYSKIYECHGCGNKISFKNPNYNEPILTEPTDWRLT